MGVMTGKILQNEFVVMDVIPLPVEGTETRVNAMAAGYEYMVNYVTSLNRVGHEENVVGWYHSHPGYGCWLSGIDVGTQRQSQSFQDPFLALVIDPNRTIAAGKVEIGAFRTYPLDKNNQPITSASGALSNGKDSGPGGASESTSMSIPSGKLKDFGVHARFYYQLDISYFKSSLDSKLLDLLWNKYWASTLSQSSLLANYSYTTNQIHELSLKTDAATAAISQQLKKNDPGSQIANNKLPSRYKPFVEDDIRDVRDEYLVEHGRSGKRPGKPSSKNITIPHYSLIGTGLTFSKPNTSGQKEAASTSTNSPNKKKKVTEAQGVDSSPKEKKKRSKLVIPTNLTVISSTDMSESVRGDDSKRPLSFAVDKKITDAVQQSTRTGTDQMHSLISQELRDHLFASISNHQCSH